MDCLQVLLDGRLEGLGVCADDLGDLLAVLEQQEGGHGADAEFLRDVVRLVDVDLVELGLRVLFGELGHRGRDGLARPAPRREAVEHHQRAVGEFGDLRVKGGLVREVVDTHFQRGGCKVSRSGESGSGLESGNRFRCGDRSLRSGCFCGGGGDESLESWGKPSRSHDDCFYVKRKRKWLRSEVVVAGTGMEDASKC